MSTTEKKTKVQQKSNLLKEKKNRKSLNEYLFKLGCLGKNEKLTFKPDGWSKQNITCPDIDHPDNNPSAVFNSKSKTIHCFVCDKTWKLEEALKQYRKKRPSNTASIRKPAKNKSKRPTEDRLSTKSDLPLISPFDYPGVHNDFIKYHKIVAAYPYTDEDGMEQYYKFRTEPKSFLLGRIERWETWENDCDLELHLNLKGVKEGFPYNLPRVLKSENIIIVEGEKDSDNLQEWLDENDLNGWATTTFITSDKKRITLGCQYLKDKIVYLCADIDGIEKKFKGEKYMYQIIGAIVSEICKSTKVLALKLKSGEDVSDLIERNPDKLLNIIKGRDSLPDWTTNYFVDTSNVPKEVLEINKKHAVVRAAPKTVILYENDTDDTDDRPFYLLDINGTRQFFRNQPIPNPQAKKDKRIKASINPFEYWMDWPSRNTFKKIVFDPSGEWKPLGEGKPSDNYNTWRGFIPTKGAKSCDRILNHIREIAVKGNKKHFDWLMDWFADIVQNPATEPRGTAVVVKGGRGSGKSIIGDYMGRILGPHYKLIDTPDHIFGKFNYHLTYKVFVQIEEVVWGGNKKQEGKLKSLITSRSLPVEIKFGDLFSMRNYLRMMITSNEDWVVPAGWDERRFFVLKTDDKYVKRGEIVHDAKCRRYFEPLVFEMKNGGPEALLLYLKDRKIKSDLGNPPHTEGLMEQKRLSLDKVYLWLYSRIFEDGTLIDSSKKWKNDRDGGFISELKNATPYIINKLQKKWVEDPVPYDVIYDDYYNFVKRMGRGVYDISKKDFSQKLGEVLEINIAKQRRIKIRNWSTEGGKKRIVCIKFPSLKECKRIFFKKTGINGKL